AITGPSPTCHELRRCAPRRWPLRLPDAPDVVKDGGSDYLPLVHVTINGEPEGLTDGMTIADLVARLGLSQRRIAVELNRSIIARERSSATSLREGDEVEIVHFVGGG